MIVQIEGLLAQEELDQLNRQLAGLAFEDGRLSAGVDAQRAKNNLQLRMDTEPRARPLAEAVVRALDRSPLFFAAALPHRYSAPFFNRYEAGMTYGDHVDNALMGPDRVRSDLSVTVFLTRPEDYDGGELVIEEAFGLQRIKLAAGSAVVYPGTSVHRVEPVTRGARQAAILWVESMVRDEARRRILFDLDRAINSLRTRQADMPEVGLLVASYQNLLRQWAGA
jgi:PKHD-type hydroxylase